jgi:hypothetical protein
MQQQVVQGKEKHMATIARMARDENLADSILINGRVFTADPAQPFAEAVAIRGEWILAVGASDAIAALAHANTRRIDLRGHTVIPGINDAHYHFPGHPLGGHRLSLQSMEPSWQETQDALADATKQVPAGTWIFGTIGGGVIAEAEADRFGLDRIVTEHPVALMQYAGAGFIINTKAMQAFDIGETEPDPMGGRYERAAGSRRVNGKLFGYAKYRLFRRLVDHVPDADIVQALQALAHEALRYGVTSIQDMSFVPPDRYIKLLQEAQMPIRVRLIRFPLDTIHGRDLTEGRDLPLHPSGQHRVTAHGTKWIVDGTPFEWGAALRGLYVDRPGWSGTLNFSEIEIASMARESLQLDDQLLLHCSGDLPVLILFDAMEQMPGVAWAEKRVRIEHGDGVVGDLIARARRLGAIVVQNPTHLSLASLVAERFGPDTPFFRLRSLLEAGVPLAFGSDGPMNPFLNIMFATLHPIHPAEAITREQAITLYTRGSAFAEFEEEDKGTIAAGKLADIAVLSQDIFTVPVDALPATESILTLVGGKTVYDAQALN